jgi:hypothetical protein
LVLLGRKLCLTKKEQYETNGSPAKKSEQIDDNLAFVVTLGLSSGQRVRAIVTPNE